MYSFRGTSRRPSLGQLGCKGVDNLVPGKERTRRGTKRSFYVIPLVIRKGRYAPRVDVLENKDRHVYSDKKRSMRPFTLCNLLSGCTWVLSKYAIGPLEIFIFLNFES